MADLVLADSDRSATFTATVDVVEPLGPRVIVGLRSEEEDFHGVFSADVLDALKEGEKIGLVIRRFYVFGSKSGKLVFEGGTS